MYGAGLEQTFVSVVVDVELLGLRTAPCSYEFRILADGV